MDRNTTELVFTEDFMEVYFTRDPSYIKVYEFERIDINYWRRLIGSNWKLSIYVSVLYLAFVHYGQKWMSKRKPFDLSRSLTFWNGTLALFSIVGLTRSAPELIYLLSSTSDGFYRSVCTPEAHSQPTSFFGLLFVLSKFVELGDTVFLVLRKKNIIFLHWYHHLTVLNCCYFGYEWYESTFRYFSCINFLVHSAMYSYFSLMSAGFKLPKGIAMSVTFLQIIQMAGALVVTLYSLWIKYIVQAPCLVSGKSISLALAMYISYFILFAILFKNSYLRDNANYKRNTKIQARSLEKKGL